MTHNVKKDRFFNLPVTILVALSFMLGMSEFIMVGILPDIAAGLKVSEVTVGNLVSLFALVYAPVTPLGSALSARFPRFATHLTLVASSCSATCCARSRPTMACSSSRESSSHSSPVRLWHCHDVRSRCDDGTISHEIHRMGVLRLLHRIRRGGTGRHDGWRTCSAGVGRSIWSTCSLSCSSC